MRAEHARKCFVLSTSYHKFIRVTQVIQLESVNKKVKAVHSVPKHIKLSKKCKTNAELRYQIRTKSELINLSISNLSSK